MSVADVQCVCADESRKYNVSETDCFVLQQLLRAASAGDVAEFSALAGHGWGDLGGAGSSAAALLC